MTPMAHREPDHYEIKAPLNHVDTVCPVCQGTDLDKSPFGCFSSEYQGFLHRIECENCGSIWDGIFRIGGYTNLDQPKPLCSNRETANALDPMNFQ